MKAILISTAAMAVVTPALADPQTPTTGPCAGVYVSVAALSDYRFDGVSESNLAPTWQTTLYCYRNDGLFAGTTLTGVNFEDQPRTPLEADFYGGRQVQWHGATVRFELLYSAFPGKRAPGPSYDIVEPQAQISRTYGGLTLEGLGAWQTSVSGGGQQWHARAGVSYALTRWLSLNGHAGRFFAARGADFDHDTFDVGATATWRRLTLDARYGGTDLTPAHCYFTRWCAPGAYASATWRLLP
ncbi:MAG TPA: TorF family putative porin [Caulobacteraceae bacterium]|nr:TorF family putative porin [Caulobacteraceae bacterium]